MLTAMVVKLKNNIILPKKINVPIKTNHDNYIAVEYFFALFVKNVQVFLGIIFHQKSVLVCISIPHFRVVYAMAAVIS